MSGKKPRGFMNPAGQKIGGLLTSPIEQRELRRKLAIECYENLISLAEYFGIHRDDPELFFKLSLNLAIKHYPVKKKRGREFVWTPWMEALVYVEITRLREIDTKAKLASLFSDLLEDPAWAKFIKDKQESGSPETVIKKHYYAGRKHPAARTLMDTYRLHQKLDTLDSWNLLVHDLLHKPL